MSDLRAVRVTRGEHGLAIFDGDTLLWDCLSSLEVMHLLTGTTERPRSNKRLIADLPFDANYQDISRRHERDRQAFATYVEAPNE